MAFGRKERLWSPYPGRKVVVYPDIDAYDYWRERLVDYPNIIISDYLQKVAGVDIDSYKQ